MKQRRRIAVLTGTRADFGLLAPVMRAVRDHESLELQTIVTGTHLLEPARTIDEVAAEFPIDCTFSMQDANATGRLADAAAIGRAFHALARELPTLDPDVMLVLGDRIEAFSGAAAASVAGIRVAHMHGGDRAEGVADEAMRHAITKLAHIHLPATEQSAARIERMGEDPQRIHIVGSPAIDDLQNFPPIDEDSYTELHAPKIAVLMHPVGRDDAEEQADMRVILDCCAAAGRVFALHPNHDAGHEGIRRAIDESGLPSREHLPRRAFIGLLRRVSVLVGNSSAGLIEAAALGVPAINIGSRQNGRQSPESVVSIAETQPASLRNALQAAVAHGYQSIDHPFGNGTAGLQTAAVLATFDPAIHPITKRNTY